MKEDHDYARDIVEMRSLMERSSKNLSVSGFAGVMAGIYALIGCFIAYRLFNFNPVRIVYDINEPGSIYEQLPAVLLVAIVVLVLAMGTAIILSYRKAGKRNENLWNHTSRRLLFNMAVPLVTGGILILIFISRGLIGLIAPASLLFYGLALYCASKFTYDEMRGLGLVQIALGLVASYFVEYGVLIWALGFGVVHIVYGIFLYLRYDK